MFVLSSLVVVIGTAFRGADCPPGWFACGPLTILDAESAAVVS